MGPRSISTPAPAACVRAKSPAQSDCVELKIAGHVVTGFLHFPFSFLKGAPMIPSDPIILLSYVNTKLRDRDKDLATFCRKEETDQDALCRKLAEVGYTYNPTRNQFV